MAYDIYAFTAISSSTDDLRSPTFIQERWGSPDVRKEDRAAETDVTGHTAVGNYPAFGA